MTSILHRLAGVAALLGLAASAAAAPLTHIGDPEYAYSFHAIVSDGQGGVKPPKPMTSGSQSGGALRVTQQFSPPFPNAPPIVHAEVYSSEGGVSFWTKTFSSPTNLFPPEDTAIGGIAELLIYQTFRRDDPNGTFKMQITDLFLRASELRGPTNNAGLFGSVVFEMTLYDSTDRSVPFPVIDAFGSATPLYGRGLDWTLDNTGPLKVDVTAGGLKDPGVSVDLLEPYVRPLNVSSIDVGEYVSVEFRVVTTAWDTVQFDSVMQAFGRDPLDPARGSFFEYEGFTPVQLAPAIPEPQTWALLLLGLGATAWRRLRVQYSSR